MAMQKVRENKLADAHRILVKGLEFIPDDKLLLEDMKQVEDAF